MDALRQLETVANLRRFCIGNFPTGHMGFVCGDMAGV